jgi:hypothetical protein
MRTQRRARFLVPALALVAVLLLGPAAEGKKPKKRVFRFGDRALSVGMKGKDVPLTLQLVCQVFASAHRFNLP